MSPVMTAAAATVLDTSRKDRLELLAETLFRPMGADGVYARTGLHEGVVDALTAMITRYRHPRAEMFRFPPVMSRKMIETSGYLKSFPNLLGCMCCLQGSEADIRGSVGRFVEGEGAPWTDDLSAGDLVLTPCQLLPRLSHRRRARPCARRRASCSTWPATVSAANRPRTSTACSPSACVNTSASARRNRSLPSARTG